MLQDHEMYGKKLLRMLLVSFRLGDFATIVWFINQPFHGGK
jgi:hypothetical protein